MAHGVSQRNRVSPLLSCRTETTPALEVPSGYVCPCLLLTKTQFFLTEFYLIKSTKLQ